MAKCISKYLSKYINNESSKYLQPNTNNEYNSTAWMTSVIFQHRITKWNNFIKLTSPKRHLLLIVDKAKGYYLETQLSNIKLTFKKILFAPKYKYYIINYLKKQI